MDLDQAVPVEAEPELDDITSPKMGMISIELSERDKQYTRQLCIGYAVQLTKNGDAASVIRDANSFEQYIMTGVIDGSNGT